MFFLIVILRSGSSGITSLLCSLCLLLLLFGESLLGELSISTDPGDLLGRTGSLRTSWLTLGGLSSVDSVVQNTHALRLAVWDEVDSDLLISHLHLVNVVKTTSLELEIASLRQVSDDTLSDSNVLES